MRPDTDDRTKRGVPAKYEIGYKDYRRNKIAYARMHCRRPSRLQFGSHNSRGNHQRRASMSCKHMSRSYKNTSVIPHTTISKNPCVGRYPESWRCCRNHRLHPGARRHCRRRRRGRNSGPVRDAVSRMNTRLRHPDYTNSSPSSSSLSSSTRSITWPSYGTRGGSGLTPGRGVWMSVGHVNPGNPSCALCSESPSLPSTRRRCPAGPRGAGERA